ncbi:MAG: AbrB/MazE/SpoVT family DNA-binding domain-containing protein, partial [Candidatus Baldrarchaeia archaeon]
MGEVIVVVDDRGRVLIPSEYRRRLNLKPGSKLKLKIV